MPRGCGIVILPASYFHLNTPRGLLALLKQFFRTGIYEIKRSASSEQSRARSQRGAKRMLRHTKRKNVNSCNFSLGRCNLRRRVICFWQFKIETVVANSKMLSSRTLSAKRTKNKHIYCSSLVPFQFSPVLNYVATKFPDGEDVSSHYEEDSYESCAATFELFPFTT